LSTPFHAPVVDLVAKRAAHLAHGRLLRCLSARLLRDPDQHIVRGAELLELHFAETERAKRAAHLRKIGRPGLRLYLDQSAALEIDTEIQAMKEIKRDRDNRQ